MLEDRFSKRAYEGLASYNTGIKKGKQIIIEHLDEVCRPIILTILESIGDISTEDTVIDLANDCYNYFASIDFSEFGEDK